MWGECKYCKKNLSCRKPVGWSLGFCENDFEPKEEKSAAKSSAVMRWVKTGNRRWEAVGKKGKFVIEQCMNTFWGRYLPNDGIKPFNMFPREKLSEAKALCEKNFYWE